MPESNVWSPEEEPGAPRVRSRSVGSAYGTFGELLQGALQGGGEFLVTLPIARWSTATFEYSESAANVEVVPPSKSKAKRVAESMIKQTGGGGGVLTLTGALPEGKGLASSSADLVATARAVGSALGMKLTGETIEGFLRDVEPSDGVMHRGVVAFDHRNVSLIRPLGDLPPMTIVGIDEGGTVDTVEYNRNPKNFSVTECAEYETLLLELEQAIEASDMYAIGRVATRSAHMNQSRCPKRTLSRMTEICAEVGAVGVATSHSGTTVGLLLPHEFPDFRHRLAAAVARCTAYAGANQVLCYQTIDFRRTERAA
jgi:uncharacterized protein involved in propanediol utilization